MAARSFRERLAQIRKVFDVEKILRTEAGVEYIQHYYKINKWMYSLFHTRSGFLHMGISRSGVYSEDDLREHSRIVARYIPWVPGAQVLELATGRGANSAYIAGQRPDAKFYGIDISSAQLSLAQKKARLLENFFPSKGDYHDLSQFKDASFDVVFVIEALCHSIRKQLVLTEVYRVLKPGGVCIVVDGYAKKVDSDLSTDEREVKGLVEKGMSVERFEPFLSFRSTAKEVGFTVADEQDVSLFVIPSMERFEKLAALFFNHPLLAKLVRLVLPSAVVYNAPAGYLMPESMRQGLFCYMVTVLQKNV